jgi:DNA-binding beta-propeller fold protein YncE
MKTGRLPFARLLCLLFLASLAMPQTGSAQVSSNHRLEFAYAVDQNSNTLFGFKVGANGALTPLAPPSFATGNAPNGVVVDPSGRFVYVVNILSNNVSGYAIGENGTLKPVPGSPFPAGSGPGWITVDPTGRFVYVANCADLCSGSGQGSVSGYAIDRATGALVAVPGSPFIADQIPYAVTVDPEGAFAYVANFRSGTVSVFKIDRCSGSLGASIQTVPTGGASPIALTLDPQGHFLYVVNTQGNNVSAFTVGNDGRLTVVPGSPFASGTSTQGVAVDPSGDFVYVTQGFDVLGYSIGISGELIPLAGSPFAAPGFLVSLTMDRSGHFVYGAAAAASAGVAAFVFDAKTGNLTAVPGSPFAAGTDTVFVTTTRRH